MSERVERVVAVGDIHGRPHPGLEEAIAACKPDVLVLGGDTFNAGQYSSHPKSYQEPVENFKEEYARMRAFMQSLSYIPKIKVMRGNHDDWPFRKLQNPDLEMFWNDPLDQLVEDLDNCEVVRTKLKSRETDTIINETPYVYIYKSVWFSHANLTSCMKLNEWYDKWRDRLAIKPVVALVQFHTHKWRSAKERGRWIAEPGMGADPCVEAYKVNYNANWEPGVPGFLYMEFMGNELTKFEPKVL